ncbi:MAG: hypothetical protein LLF96_13195 [Eubacteriales bacterium]|nr:hypothetical protein [Eubacteriales bacterium]
MSIQTQVIQALRAMIDALALFAPIAVGPLPEGEGLVLAVSSGRAETVTLSHGGTSTLDVALACKHAQQATAMDTLCHIHEALSKTATLPGGDGWQMIAVRTASAPGYADREGPLWLYGSALTLTYATD